MDLYSERQEVRHENYRNPTRSSWVAGALAELLHAEWGPPKRWSTSGGRRVAGFWPARFSGTQDTGPNYEERLLDLSCCEKVHEASVFLSFHVDLTWVWTSHDSRSFPHQILMPWHQAGSFKVPGRQRATASTAPREASRSVSAFGRYHINSHHIDQFTYFTY